MFPAVVRMEVTAGTGETWCSFAMARGVILER